jgi:hypothetical protein
MQRSRNWAAVRALQAMARVQRQGSLMEEQTRNSSDVSISQQQLLPQVPDVATAHPSLRSGTAPPDTSPHQTPSSEGVTTTQDDDLEKASLDAALLIHDSELFTEPDGIAIEVSVVVE